MVGKVDIVYTGIPEVRIDRDEARKRVVGDLGVEDADPLISVVGRLVPGKGHLELVEIAPRLLEELPQAKVLFVGDMPPERLIEYVERLHRRIDELKLDHMIRFLGHRDDALTVIAASDLIVIPSVSTHQGIETEGFPLLALEAMAIGTPVVAVGGLPELLEECGGLVPSGDRDALLQGILRLIKDHPAWERSADCGRERARTAFSDREMVAKLLGVYLTAKR
jgi:glycosyltransferase involved in cell wall biosynthesis